MNPSKLITLKFNEFSKNELVGEGSKSQFPPKSPAIKIFSFNILRELIRL